MIITLHPEDSLQIKQTVVVSFEVRYNLYILLCLYDIEHSFVFRKPTLTRGFNHLLIDHSDLFSCCDARMTDDKENQNRKILVIDF